jgi:putative membrane protein
VRRCTAIRLVGAMVERTVFSDRPADPDYRIERAHGGFAVSSDTVIGLLSGYIGEELSAGPVARRPASTTLALMFALLHVLVLAATILILARLLPSVRIKSVGTSVVVAIVFSVLNFFVGWFIRALLFVPAVLTLGLLFLFVPLIVNTVLLWVTDKLLASFEIQNTRSLLISAAVITVVNGIFYAPLLHAVAQGYGYQQSQWI